MKKTTMIVFAIMFMCAYKLSAQTEMQLPAAVSQKFKDDFGSASNIRWEKVSGEIFLARFNRQDQVELAYIDYEGKLLMTGKLLNINDTPQVLGAEFDKIKAVFEPKFGALSITQIFQLSEKNKTRYYTNMGNNRIYLALLSESNGKTRVVKRTQLDLIKASDSHLIVKK